MAEGFTWKSHLRIVLLLVTINGYMLHNFTLELYGGFLYIIVAALFLLFLGTPVIFMQVVMGQYSSSGLIQIWRSFPIARGLAIVWLLNTFFVTCIYAQYGGRSLIFAFHTLASTEYPWLTCNNEWNTDFCSVPSFNETASELPATTVDPWDREPHEPHDDTTDPDVEFAIATEKLNPLYIITIGITWLLAAAAVIRGPLSLIWSFFILFFLIHGLNILLFFRAISLPGVGNGFKLTFKPEEMSFHFRQLDTWIQILKVVLGSWFLAPNGSLLVIGKYMKKTTFCGIHILISVVAVLAINVLSSSKIAGFVGYFSSLTGKEDIDFYNRYYFIFSSVPTMLSTLPASSFWLLVHFLFNFFSFLPAMIFSIEIIATSIADVLPGDFSERTNFPKSAILPAIIATLGFLMSLLFSHSIDGLVSYQFFDCQNLIFFSFFFLFVTALAPLAVSKVVNIGKEDLLTYFGLQGGGSMMLARKIWIKISLVLTGLVLALLLVFYKSLWIDQQFIGYYTDAQKMFLGIWLGVGLLIIILSAAVQCILHCARGDGNLCCRSVGRPLSEDEREEGKDFGVLDMSDVYMKP